MVAERDAALREPLARGEPITGRELAGTKAALLIGQVDECRTDRTAFSPQWHNPGRPRPMRP